jgi:hypothetical protein
MPLTIPVDPIVATPVFPLLHAPSDVTSARLVVAPGHTVNVPVIKEGSGLIVAILVVAQPVGNVKVITAVPPATPPTEPPAPIVATAVLPLLHVPLASLNEVVAPAHTEAIPLMAEGNGFTVTTVVVLHAAPAE